MNYENKFHFEVQKKQQKFQSLNSRSQQITKD